MAGDYGYGYGLGDYLSGGYGAYKPPVAKAPPWALLNSQYSPYGMGDYAGGQTPGPQPYQPPYVPPAIGPGIAAHEPGFQLGKRSLLNTLATARALAQSQRSDAATLHGSNIQAVNSSAAERGVGFGGTHVQLLQKENDAYAKQQRDIATQLAQARSSYGLGLAGLGLEDFQWAQDQPKMNYPAGSNLAAILATIRQRESGGNYLAQNPNSTASGAYQFVNGTWQNLLNQYNLKGPTEAWRASQQLQDQVASRYAAEILSQHGGNAAWVPATWYAGGGGAAGPWNVSPNGGQTIQDYVNAWLQVYGQLYGGGYGGGQTGRKYG